jgi:hypothetical protein
MSWEFLGISVAAFFTLSLYSFLYKDNPFYKLAEHIFARFISRLSWLSRLSLAFVVGNTAGITLIQQLHGMVLPQVRSTFLNVVTFSGIIMVLGVISVLIYFYFSKEHKGALGFVAQIGIWFIMISFGASFGYTVMARVSLLIGRAQFLLTNWLQIIK